MGDQAVVINGKRMGPTTERRMVERPAALWVPSALRDKLKYAAGVYGQTMQELAVTILEQGLEPIYQAATEKVIAEGRAEEVRDQVEAEVMAKAREEHQRQLDEIWDRTFGGCKGWRVKPKVMEAGSSVE